MSAQSAVVRLQLALFLLALRWLPLALFGSRFERLPAAKQDRVLRWLENSPLLLLRTGFWGLKTLVFMGYYGNVAIWSRVAYAPQREGNRMLHV